MGTKDVLVLINLLTYRSGRVEVFFIDTKIRKLCGAVDGDSEKAAIADAVDALKSNGLKGKLRIVARIAAPEVEAPEADAAAVLGEALATEAARQAPSVNKAFLLRPGFLVVLKTKIRGGVEYTRRDLDERCAIPGKDAMGGKALCKLLKGHTGKCNFAEMTAEEITRWETTRTIADKVEHDKAVKVRGKARSLIASTCTDSEFGHICVESKEADLDAAYLEAKALIAAFNADSKYMRVDLYMLKGRVAQDDEIAAKAIGSEIRELIDQMTTGIAKADPEAIRAAANKARELGQMLDPNVQETVSAAIDEARSAARAIIKRVEGAGENAATVVQELSRKSLQEARMRFLDMDGEEITAKPKAAAAKVEEANEEPIKSRPRTAARRDLEV